MKLRNILYIFIISLFYSCNNDYKPRIGISGLGIESSTFSPARTTEKEFNIKYNEDIFSNYSFFNDNYLNKAEWLPSMTGKAIPGGVVTKEAYELMVTDLIERTKKTEQKLCKTFRK